MLTLYFSATGNTKYIAELFSTQMNAKCISIEEDTDFSHEINNHDTIAFCYPIYGSRVPRNMREFVEKHMLKLHGKRIIIFVTQMMFSGDGARVFTDMFREGAIEVIYAEHFNLPNNIGNTPLLRKASDKSIERQFMKAETKMLLACQNIKNGIVIKRGFSSFSKALGYVQGRAWQGDSKNINLNPKSIESKAKDGVKIHKECTLCSLCVKICPVNNLENDEGKIKAKGDCIICYRCVNRCPHRAITVLGFHIRAKWQYQAPNYRGGDLK